MIRCRYLYSIEFASVIDSCYVHDSSGKCWVHVIFNISGKWTKFPFPTMDYRPWSSKNLIDRNRLKKYLQVGIDVTCMHTSFDGRDFFGFGDMATLKNGQISLSDHGQSMVGKLVCV